jgi:hypothetical protein
MKPLRSLKQSSVERNLAIRMYDDLIGTFGPNETLDEQTRKNDLTIIRQITDGLSLSLALLNAAGWRP